MNVQQLGTLLEGQSPRILDAVIRLVRRIIAKHRTADVEAIEREIDAVFADVGHDIHAAYDRLADRFPEESRTDDGIGGES